MVLYMLLHNKGCLLPLQKPLQECSPLRGLRRYDSCGSLDSRNVNQITKEYNCYNSQEYSSTHKGEKVANTTEEGDSGKFLMNHNNELTAETDELCNPSVHLHAPRYTSNETQVQILHIIFIMQNNVNATATISPNYKIHTTSFLYLYK